MADLNSITLEGARSSFRLGGVFLRRTQLHRHRNGTAHAGGRGPGEKSLCRRSTGARGSASAHLTASCSMMMPIAPSRYH